MNSSERLAHLIRQLGLTQKKLSDDLGVSQSTISRYLNGRRMDNVTAYAISKLYNINNEWLVEGKGKMLIDGELPIRLLPVETEMLDIIRRIPKKEWVHVRAILETFLPK